MQINTVRRHHPNEVWAVRLHYEEVVLEKKELEETVDKLREKVRYLEATSL